MFKYQESTLGPFRQDVFSDDATGTQLIVAPDRGACLLSIKFGETEILDAYTSPAELDADRWAKNMPLFPFPNRLDGGIYQWEGETYQFPRSDEITGNAIHGFAMEQPFELAVTDRRVNSVRAKYQYNYEGTNPAYPFPAQFTVEMTLHTTGKFSMVMGCTNKGDKSMPVGFGFHPYFQLGEKADELEMQLPPCKLVGLNERMLPTGKRYEFDDFNTLRPIRSTVLDNCFALTGSEPEAIAIIRGKVGKLEYWQEKGETRFEFLQVFIPPYRTSVALEPMTCNVNAFNNQEGLIALDPRATAESRWGVQFIPAG